MSEGLEGLLAGRTLVGRYRIEEVIGRGGFAVVYRAEDLRLARPVAVKVITPPTLDSAARERLRELFQHEARAAASLPHHPNVVAIHDFGTDRETGIDFLAMELLRGETLAQFLAREPRPPLAVALEIVREAADGLSVGHRAGLIHRDVKPGNLFLAEPHAEDERFRVCVLDFGIARLADADDATVTRHEGIPLSPAYASPEQLRGDRGLTPASDVYSLGLVAHELLGGRKVFSAERAEGNLNAPPPLSEDIPAPVRQVVERALAAEPGARFADAGAFCGALEQAASASPQAAPPVEDDRTMIIPAPRVAAQPARGKRRPWLVAIPLLAAAAGVWAVTGNGSGAADPSPGIPAESVSTAAEVIDPVPEANPVDDGGTPPAPAEAGDPTPVGQAPTPSGTGVQTPVQVQPTTPEPAPPTGRGEARPPAPRPSPQQPTRPPASPAPAQPAPSQPAPQQPAPVPAQPVPQPQPQQPPPAEPEQPRPVEPQPALPPAPRDTIRIPAIPVLP